MPLSRLMCDPETGRLTLMVDDVRNTAENLLVARIDALLKQNFTVYVYLYETRKHQLLRRLSERVIDRCHIVEYSDDLYGWNDEGSQALNVLNGLPVLPTERSSVNERFAVVVDSLTLLLQHYPVQQVCRWLKSFNRKESETLNHGQVLAVLHGDLHEERIVRLLEHTADTTISLLDSFEISSSSSSLESSLPSIQSSACKVVRKVAGKNPKITNERFTIDSSLTIRSDEVTLNPVKQSSDVADRKPAPNPAENLTFNLKVRHEESEARSKVKLPYTQTSEAVRQDMDAQLGQLDVDELEEDPDDDLDI